MKNLTGKQEEMKTRNTMDIDYLPAIKQPKPKSCEGPKHYRTKVNCPCCGRLISAIVRLHHHHQG